MSRYRHPIHPLGTYYVHGDGRPRRVRILEIGKDRKAGKVHVHDGRTRFWIAAEHLSRSAKPAPAPKLGPLDALALKRTGGPRRR